MLKWLKSVITPSVETKPPLANTVTVSDEEKISSEQWRQRGNQFLDQNNLVEALNCYRKSLSLNKDDVASLVNLGFILAQTGDNEEAHNSFSRALDLDPSNVDALFSLGNLYKQRRAFHEAIDYYQKTLTIQADFDFCRKELCEALVLAGTPALAITCFIARPFFVVNSFEFHAYKAHLHLQADQEDSALKEFQAAATIQASNPNIQLQLACLFLRKKNFSQAQHLLRKILATDPKHSEALSFLAASYQLQGQTAKAVTSYRQAIELDQKNLTAHQNLLYALSYDEQCTPTAYLEEAKTFAAKLRVGVTPAARFHSQKNESSPLRLGFVSGDLRGHPVGLFLESALAEISRTDFQCIAYANYPVEDAISQRLKKLFCEWNVVSSLNDDELSEKIQLDRVDILIDLAGHTERNRLAVFCRKPAPVQVAWLGYWASTGLSEIDYILVDDKSVEDGDEAYFTERPYRLPGSRLCMSIPQTTRPLTPNQSPALQKGHITFGSFQVMSKINRSSLQLWAQVMQSVPNSRLRLQNAAFDHEDARLEFLARLTKEGFDTLRIDLYGSMSYTDYLAAHAEVDIILDTYPFPGGTTTAEAIWMGVPTLSLRGRDLLSRQGESMLTCVGIPDWVAKDKEDFVAIAVAKANDLNGLSQTRQCLRQAALSSPLFNAPLFSKNLTTAFREIWQEKMKA
ncbi:tetratricopeptide repeat protein [Undibacterium sp. LX40W]|uniref:protein O-GlcNAc transferase n=1 Tax=Undibacterium nitidum TaxID=2762298 RepID=A0A923HQ22_9BURK|nr:MULTISPECIES: glycosyltransferase family 41 protein [Undibacterium]MBC3880372.1 tetratricopeptide repeat protein [Undibacterium nitidum]MBC3890891.1 tetratricopeptide repeat protein [Undibacterium sp. LX40W]